MTLILEDGTGVVSANSYANASMAADYHAVRGNITQWLAMETAFAVDGMLIDATRLLEQTFVWLGTIATTTQGLGLPRLTLTMKDGRAFNGAAQVAIAADAVSELSLKLYSHRIPADGRIVKSLTLPDASWTYDTSKVGEYQEVDRILAPLIAAGGLGGGMKSATLARWS